MPKAPEHFDYAALAEQVLQQDLGLVITTNNPGGFRRVMYTYMRQNPSHRFVIDGDPAAPNRLFLLRRAATELTETPETSHG